MVISTTLQPNRKLTPRPNLFQILISAFSHPTASLIKCTVHTDIKANKTQWNPNRNHSWGSLQEPPLAGLRQSCHVSGRCALKMQIPACGRAAVKGWMKRSPELRSVWPHCSTAISRYIKLDIYKRKIPSPNYVDQSKIDGMWKAPTWLLGPSKWKNQSFAGRKCVSAPHLVSTLGKDSVENNQFPAMQAAVNYSQRPHLLLT